jgi:hypothetical protein
LIEAASSIEIVMQFRSVAIATPHVQNVLGRSCAGTYTFANVLLTFAGTVLMML